MDKGSAISPGPESDSLSPSIGLSLVLPPNLAYKPGQHGFFPRHSTIGSTYMNVFKGRQTKHLHHINIINTRDIFEFTAKICLSCSVCSWSVGLHLNRQGHPVCVFFFFFFLWGAWGGGGIISLLLAAFTCQHACLSCGEGRSQIPQAG